MGRLEVVLNISLPQSTEDIFEKYVPDILEFLVKRTVEALNLEEYSLKTESSTDASKTFGIYDSTANTRVAKISVTLDRLKGTCRIDISQ